VIDETGATQELVQWVYASACVTCIFVAATVLSVCFEAVAIILYYARWQHKNKKNTAVKMKNTHNYRRKIMVMPSRKHSCRAISSRWAIVTPIPDSFQT